MLLACCRVSAFQRQRKTGPSTSDRRVLTLIHSFLRQEIRTEMVGKASKPDACAEHMGRINGSVSFFS
jgi:hypothetical protein